MRRKLFRHDFRRKTLFILHPVDENEHDLASDEFRINNDDDDIRRARLKKKWLSSKL